LPPSRRPAPAPPQWRDASGGCAAKLAAPMPAVLGAIQMGDAQALAIDQVWQNLSAQLHEFVGMPPAGLDPAPHVLAP
jgi:hypothetical protein